MESGKLSSQMGAGWRFSFPATQEVNLGEERVLVSGLAFYHVFYSEGKSSNFIFAEEAVEEFVYRGFLIWML